MSALPPKLLLRSRFHAANILPFLKQDFCLQYLDVDPSLPIESKSFLQNKALSQHLLQFKSVLQTPSTAMKNP